VVRGPESGPRVTVRPRRTPTGKAPVNTRTRIAILLTAALTTVTVTTATVAAPASATSIPTRGQAASGWLARQMVDGDHLETVFGGFSFPDQGLTIDAILAYAATGTADDFAARATAWLAEPDNLGGYIGDGGTESYAGATAKLLLATEVRGADPSTFGGVDLPARLSALLTPSGRYSDRSAFGDFSNAFSQSLAIIALSRHGGAPASAVTFLAGTACADGGFPLDFGTSPCVSDIDATAMDTQALLAAGRTTEANAGLTWLASAQQSNGGFAEVPGSSPDANSTGLAGQALAAGGRPVRALAAKAYLIHLQVGCSGAATDRGALAFDGTGFDPATAVRATAQGILGLADIGLAHLSASGAHTGDPHLTCVS
jgi:hypothetical protein